MPLPSGLGVIAKELMPLYKTIDYCAATRLLVWKITESLEQLQADAVLNERSQLRASNMKSEMHRRGFLSVRMLLQSAGYTDFDLYYDAFGKPHLHDQTHISITHSFGFSAIILSDRKIGIDIEMRRELIVRLADKFVEQEFDYLDPENKEDYISRLTVIWGVKEAIFKIRNEIGISFKDHIAVAPFDVLEGKTTATLHFQDISIDFPVHFEEFENFTLVYVLEN